jgi:alpha-mannosidase
LPHRGTLLTLLCLVLAQISAHGLPAESAPRPYHFSPQAAAAVERLNLLSSIPAAEWQYHAGDIAEGERADLDSNDWQTIHLPFVASRQVIWLRRWVVVPKTLSGYDLTKGQIWFHLDLSGAGPGPEYAYQIVYFNGLRAAEGRHLERQLLFANAKPGARALIAVKLLAT